MKDDFDLREYVSLLSGQPGGEESNSRTDYRILVLLFAQVKINLHLWCKMLAFGGTNLVSVAFSQFMYIPKILNIDSENVFLYNPDKQKTFSAKFPQKICQLN